MVTSSQHRHFYVATCSYYPREARLHQPPNPEHLRLLRDAGRAAMTTPERWRQLKLFFASLAIVQVPPDIPDEILDRFYSGAGAVLDTCIDDQIIEYLLHGDGSITNDRYFALVSGQDHPDEWMLSEH